MKNIIKKALAALCIAGLTAGSVTSLHATEGVWEKFAAIKTIAVRLKTKVTEMGSKCVKMVGQKLTAIKTKVKKVAQDFCDNESVKYTWNVAKSMAYPLCINFGFVGSIVNGRGLYAANKKYELVDTRLKNYFKGSDYVINGLKVHEELSVLLHNLSKNINFYTWALPISIAVLAVGIIGVYIAKKMPKIKAQN